MKLLNGTHNCVDEMLNGIVASRPALYLQSERRILLAPEWYQRPCRVHLLSGGGSGHEPFCAGYVGKGMLSAAVAGSVFASPPSANVLYAIRCLGENNSAGVMVIVPNYTGDCLNFGLAVESARELGIKVASIEFGEDCTHLSSDAMPHTGRRGMCGLVFVYKIAGELANRGTSLENVESTVKLIAKSSATIGFALKACTLPGADGPLFNIEDTKMELGIGVHGESGIQRIQRRTTNETVDLLISRLEDALKISPGDQIVAFVNNLGGGTELEQWVLASSLQKQLENKKIELLRLYAGQIMTALEMHGFQISFLKLPSNKLETDEWLSCLDANTEAASWSGCSLSIPTRKKNLQWPENINQEIHDESSPLSNEKTSILRNCLIAAAQALSKSENELNLLDSGCGDGDCGSTLKQLADVVLTKDGESLPFAYPRKLLSTLAKAAEMKMGGTSGAIYALFLTAASSATPDDCNKLSDQVVARIWQNGLEGIKRYSKARVGDRTMLDALIPACDVFQETINVQDFYKAFEKSVEAAKIGCESTSNMPASFGRASYVNESHCLNVDAGARGCYIWLSAIYNELCTLKK